MYLKGTENGTSVANDGWKVDRVSESYSISVFFHSNFSQCEHVLKNFSSFLESRIDAALFSLLSSLLINLVATWYPQSMLTWAINPIEANKQKVLFYQFVSAPICVFVCMYFSYWIGDEIYLLQYMSMLYYREFFFLTDTNKNCFHTFSKE